VEQALRKSHQEVIRMSVEKERKQVEQEQLEKSGVLSQELLTVMQMLDKFQQKLEPVPNVQGELEIVKEQLRDVLEFNRKMRDVSPIQLDGSCFDSLHELCNVQIDELKKALKQAHADREQLADSLEEANDRAQQLSKEKMEAEVLSDSK